MIQYKKRRKYKYNLHNICRYATCIKLKEAYTSKYIDIHQNGDLEIRAGYSWDGPSGPTRDTPNFMRGSLVHDALYQLLRDKVLDQSERNKADLILRDICIQDGMSKFRAGMVYLGVKKFAAGAARPDIKTAP